MLLGDLIDKLQRFGNRAMIVEVELEDGRRAVIREVKGQDGALVIVVQPFNEQDPERFDGQG